MFYKKVDRSLLEWGMTIPKEFEQKFLAGKPLSSGSRHVKITWDGETYDARIGHTHGQKHNYSIYQIRWDNNRDLLKKLRRTFIHSYVNIKGLKEEYAQSNPEGKQFRTRLSGGQQEVLVITPITSTKIVLSVFIRIENEWNRLFERLADENVFGWVFAKDKRYLITRSTPWYDVRLYSRHVEATNVIYYLVHTKKRLLYVGKADHFGKRVVPGRQHQGMPGDWDKFRYDIVKPEYSNILERVEDHTIRAFATILQNTQGYSSLEIGDYKLVNANWKKL